MNKFKIEVTDTFGGEANYSWVRRHELTAKSVLGAVQKLSKIEGFAWRKDFGTGDMARYNAKNACVCAFIEYAE